MRVFCDSFGCISDAVMNASHQVANQMELDENAPLMFPLAFCLRNTVPSDGWRVCKTSFNRGYEIHWNWNQGGQLFGYIHGQCF